jgi:hypothetical protein
VVLRLPCCRVEVLYDVTLDLGSKWILLNWIDERTKSFKVSDLIDKRIVEVCLENEFEDGLMI